MASPNSQYENIILFWFLASALKKILKYRIVFFNVHFTWLCKDAYQFNEMQKEQRMAVKSSKFTFLILSLLYLDVSYSQDISVRNCANIKLGSATKTLSKEERLRLLDSTLIDSIDAYSHCVSGSQEQSAQHGSGAGGAATGSGSGQIEASGIESASSESNSESENQLESELLDGANSQSESHAQRPTVNSKTGSGAQNQIVAPKDNDLIVCQILWEEISQETSEITKVELTKQYRDYQCG